MILMHETSRQKHCTSKDEEGKGTAIILACIPAGSTPIPPVEPVLGARPVRAA